MDIYKKREKCAVCGNKDLNTIMSYGDIPLAGDFPSFENLSFDTKYNLDLQFCPKCSLIQTNSIIESDILFKDYRYMASIGLSKHFNEVAKLIKDRYNPNNVLEIGSNDGVLLLPLMELGIKCVGIDPAINISKIAKDKGCNIYNNYFSEEFVEKEKLHNQFDCIVSNNCFAHIDDIHSIVKGVKKSLKVDGYFIIEVHYVRDLIEQNQYETVYHEHLYYWSITSLNELFKQYSMTIVDVDEIPIHGGSIRVVIKNSLEKYSDKILKYFSKEKELGLTSLSYFTNFGESSIKHINDVKNLLKKLKNDGNKIIGYGASGRGNIFCNLCDITPNIIDYVVDESPEKIGRYIAGTHVPIVSPKYMENNAPDYIFIFAWNYSKMIIEKLKGNNYKYIIAFPEITVIEDGVNLNKKLFI